MYSRTFLVAIVFALSGVALGAPVPDHFGAAMKSTFTTHVQISPVARPISPVARPISPVMPPLRGPGRPIIWPPFFGGFFPYYGYNYGYYAPPVVGFEVPEQFDNGPTAPGGRVVIPGNEFPATLVMQFPAEAEIWVNGQKSEEKAQEEWTLTSPVLKQGEEYTFKVKGRWKAGGKIYEVERTVKVSSGAQSRAIIVSGNEIKE